MIAGWGWVAGVGTAPTYSSSTECYFCATSTTWHSCNYSHWNSWIMVLANTTILRLPLLAPLRKLDSSRHKRRKWKWKGSSGRSKPPSEKLHLRGARRHWGSLKTGNIWKGALPHSNLLALESKWWEKFQGRRWNDCQLVLIGRNCTVLFCLNTMMMVNTSREESSCW